jgi:hypothetical protein
MERDQIGEGIPDIEGFYVDSIVTLSRPGEVMLLFYRTADDGKYIREARVTLIGSQLIKANFHMEKFYSPNVISFPVMTSYDTQNDARFDGARKILTLHFGDDFLSYAFEKAFYLTIVRSRGR